MIISYTRKDRSGNFVEVEVWRDDKTNEFVRIKRVTYMKKAGFVTFRTDIYKEENEAEFEKSLDEELNFLNEYKETVEKITTISVREEEPKEEEPKEEPDKKVELDGLAATVARLNAQNEEER